MESDSLFVGFIFIILGGITAARPDFLIRLQIWTQRVIMNAQYIPSARTYLIARIVGAFLLIIGLRAMTGILNFK